MQNHVRHLQGEEDRVRILQYMTGRTVTTVELRHKLNMTKHKLAHHIRVLYEYKYIDKEKVNGSKFVYKRTRQAYKPRKIVEVAPTDTHEDDLDNIQPTLPFARVIRMLSKPLDPAPRKKIRSGMYGHMQSGLTMFNLE